MDDKEIGFLEGSKIARLSFITLASLGVAEILVGYITSSLVTFADGIDSIGDSLV